MIVGHDITALFNITSSGLIDSPLDKLQFGDPVMAANVEKAKRVLERKVAIMLLGENGTGKECSRVPSTRPADGRAVLL